MVPNDEAAGFRLTIAIGVVDLHTIESSSMHRILGRLRIRLHVSMDVFLCQRSRGRSSRCHWYITRADELVSILRKDFGVRGPAESP